MYYNMITTVALANTTSSSIYFFWTGISNISQWHILIQINLQTVKDPTQTSVSLQDELKTEQKTIC